MITPYYQDEHVTLFNGDFREVLDAFGPSQFNAVVTDPPYGETNLEWDTWPEGWPSALAAVTNSLWCFGSLRMFFDRLAEFEGWKFSQDVVWEKHNGSGLHNDRFRRVHEHATHWYQGPWSEIHHATPQTADATPRTVRRKARPAQWQGTTSTSSYTSQDGGPRLMRSVIFARSMHSQGINETEKPLGIVSPLVEYAVPRGGGAARSVRRIRGHGRRREAVRPTRGAHRASRGPMRIDGTPTVPGRARTRCAGGVGMTCMDCGRATATTLDGPLCPDCARVALALVGSVGARVRALEARPA